MTYGELERRVAKGAGMLAAMDVETGDRIAWLGRSHEAFFELLLASARVGSCLVPINNRLAISEIAFIIDDCAADILFVTGDFMVAAEAALSRIERPIRVFTIDAARSMAGAYGPLREAATPMPPTATRAEDAVVQLYTSGTTGLPKGVPLTNDNFAAFLATGRTFEGLDYGPDDILVTPMPLFHVGGVNPGIAILASGARLVMLPAFDPGEVLRTIESEGATRIGGVPAMIGLMLQHPDAATTDFSTVKTLLYGGSPISEAVLELAFAKIGCGVMQMYGMTETTAAGTIFTVRDHSERRLRACGRPWPDHEVRIADENGAAALDGEIGEIQIRGPGVMTGYWNRPKETAETFAPGGWLKTGDAGYRDVEGYFYVHDRVKDMIVSGGENVYPAEVENAIMGCPGVVEAAVIGVPDPVWSEAVKAVIVRAEGSTLEAEAVVAWVRARIAGYKTPKTVDFIDALPKNGTGKVLRRTLREPYWAGVSRRVG